MAGTRGRTHGTKQIELVGWSGTAGELAAQLRVTEEALLDRLALADIPTDAYPIRVQCPIANPQPLFKSLWRKIETIETESGPSYRSWLEQYD